MQSNKSNKTNDANSVTSSINFLYTIELLGCLVSVHACSQNDTISVIPCYEKGQRFVLQITESSRDFEGKQITSESSNEYGIGITILDKTSKGYKVKFDLRDFIFFNDNPVIFQQIHHLNKGLVLELNLDKNGILETISNWELLRDQAYKMLDDIRRALG